MSTQQDIEDIFSILHDGIIENYSGDKCKLILKVGCLYLAELIDKDFEYFYIEINDIKKIELFAWMNPAEQEQKIYTELEDIFQAELDILSADKKDDNIVITCNQSNTEFNFCGGILTLNCLSIKVYDQNKSELTIEKFGEVCKQYWDNFEKR